MKTHKSTEDFAQSLAGTKYREFQRQQFYSLVAYPTTGSATLQLFGEAVSGTVNYQTTNLPKANSFGDVYFLIKAVRTKFYIGTRAIASAVGTDATSLLSDFLLGFAQAGVFQFSVNSSVIITVPRPFLWLAGNDRPICKSAGNQTITLTEAAPNTLLSDVSAAPWGEPASQYESRGAVYLQDPAISINPNASFDCSITYPSGLVPIIATTQVPNSTTLYVGVEFDGIVARPII